MSSHRALCAPGLSSVRACIRHRDTLLAQNDTAVIPYFQALPARNEVPGPRSPRPVAAHSPTRVGRSLAAQAVNAAVDPAGVAPGNGSPRPAHASPSWTTPFWVRSLSRGPAAAGAPLAPTARREACGAATGQAGHRVPVSLCSKPWDPDDRLRRQPALSRRKRAARRCGQGSFSPRLSSRTPTRSPARRNVGSDRTEPPRPRAFPGRCAPTHRRRLGMDALTSIP